MSVDTCIGLNERALELVEDAEVVNPEGGGSYPTIWTGDWPLASMSLKMVLCTKNFFRKIFGPPKAPFISSRYLMKMKNPLQNLYGLTRKWTPIFSVRMTMTPSSTLTSMKKTLKKIPNNY